MQEDNRPDWVKENQVPGGSPVKITIDGKEYKYTVLKKELARGLSYGVGVLSDTDLIITEGIPTLEIPFLLTHEVREKTKFANLPEEQRCLAALQQELKDFQNAYPTEYDNYLQKRFAFFTDLVDFYEQAEQREVSTPVFRQGIALSRDFLHTLAASRS